jgi:hypothetical protein
MPRPSQVVVLIEDIRHQQLIRRYLRRIGLEGRLVRFELPRSGSGEQWVREQFPVELTAFRWRNTRTATTLIIVVDADVSSVAERLAQLEHAREEAGVGPIRTDTEQVARLVPRRNIETWILCLNDIAVQEDLDYKRTRNDWAELIPPAAETLYAWTRPNAAIPVSCLDSLRLGLAELRRLDFRDV